MNVNLMILKRQPAFQQTLNPQPWKSINPQAKEHPQSTGQPEILV